MQPIINSNVITGDEATKGMMRGVSLAVDLIRPTYGGAGSNVVVESHLRPFHGIYNDAWSIVKAIKATDPAEKIGLNFVKELCERADKLSGDSRKTTLILMDEILKAGYEADINKLKLKRELDALIPIIEAEIDKQTKQISVDEVESVATTASENPETGKLLQEIYQKIGKNGIIQPEGSGTFETSYRFIDGVRFDMTGYLSNAFANTGDKAIYEKPLILITKKKITTDDEINPLLTEMLTMEDRRPLIIFTQDMDSGIASMLVDLHKSKRLEICIIKAPTLWQDYVFQDFAKCVGATIIEDATGLNLKKIPLSALGTCDKITVDADETILTGTQDISEHIAHLNSKGDDDSNLRLSWLTNKTAILKLGANSETDLSYKLLKLHDAIRSSQLALKYGIVSGGGLCLWRIANQTDNELWKSEAGRIMTVALNAPLKQIAENCAINQAEHIDKLPDNIVDASMVVKMAVRNSVGIASTILTASSLIYIPEPTAIELALMSKQQNAF
jgi:chaperonin GroEL